MSKFSELWDSKIKTLASKCIDFNVLKLINEVGDKEPTAEQLVLILNYNHKYTDILAMTNISKMSFEVEHALANTCEAIAYTFVFNIHSTLDSNSYWENVFNNNFNSEEAKNLLALRDGLFELMHTV